MRASVVIVSRHRPALLRRCLTALRQQDHPAFEVVVVADPAGIAATEGLAIKRAGFDQANISAARNLGIGLAAGDVVAFIDDDAVAEPTWLSRLVAPFADPAVIAATGFVRGRNGISYQWQGAEVDRFGEDHPLAASATLVRAGSPDRTIKPQGTNCAFRRDVLAGAGGFDPAFRFFHDETDLALRIAGQGATALVPDAQVHHGFAAGPYRRTDRVPVTLHEIAASTALFLRRHAGGTGAGWPALRAREWRRAVGHMVAGRIEPRDLRRLMASLAEGWQDGLSRALFPPSALTAAPPPFLPLPETGPRAGMLLSGRSADADRLRSDAAAAVAAGRVVTLLLFAHGARAHRHGFTDGGWWEQTGGLWGQSDRGAPRITRWTQDARTRAEAERIAPYRPLK
ncbi:MAG: hypothetical protein RIR62_1432 [Pseudomonadota bacterium]